MKRMRCEMCGDWFEPNDPSQRMCDDCLDELMEDDGTDFDSEHWS
jgi:hypothetical protein